MKVQHPTSPVTPPANGVASVEGTAGPNFAAKLGSAQRIETTSPAETNATQQAGIVSDIAADLQAGKCTPAQALEKVVERVVERKLGPDAPAALRANLADALRNALREDPMLAAKVAQLD